ncbi:MAG: hypothetical protein J7623_04285 [Chitinophaga sp.]|uniref:hypothetical protein n=1 Tax=Chitinophaga sp. TaxID=1869181 RepID=UPI001B0DEECC|nr:hypothetical protein [Chitinophaga sp.]MBO9727835.1 hypothetical protein [Chitinophaga sp.]
MIKYFWLKSSVLLLFCWLPLKIAGQTVTPDTAIAMQTDSISAVANDEEEVYQEDMAYYDMRHISDSLINDLKANKKLQYHDVKEKPPQEFRWLDRFLVALGRSIHTIRYILMGLLLAGLGFLVYRYMKANGMALFRKPVTIDGLTEIQTEELHSGEEYEEKIKAAIAAGDTRQAIRWWYLYTLYQLAGKQMIVAGREKTNNDYLRNMRSSPYYKKFAALTLDYEYSWYGGFEVSEENFRNINQQFRDFNNAIGKTS